MLCQVKDLMTSEPATVRESSTIDDVLAALVSAGAAEVYVTDDEGRLLGVVPDYELLKARMAQVAGCEPVDRLICRSMTTVHPDSPIDAATAVFRESCHRVLAVCDAGRLVGQLRRYDVLRQMDSIRVIEQEVPTSQESIEAEVRVPRFMQPKQSLASLVTKREI